MTMGISFSKGGEPQLIDERSVNRATKKSSEGDRFGSKHTSTSTAEVMDEIQSKGTESTKGSPDLMSLPRAQPPKRTTNNGAGLLGWFRRPTAASQPSRRRHEQEPRTKPPQQIVLRSSQQDSSTHVPTRSRPIPRKRSSSDYASFEEEDIENLKRIYDMRTWDMYLRITEARARRSSSYHQPEPTFIPGPTYGPATNERPSYYHSDLPTTMEDSATRGLAHHVTESSPGDHELIFGDLDS